MGSAVIAAVEAGLGAETGGQGGRPVGGTQSEHQQEEQPHRASKPTEETGPSGHVSTLSTADILEAMSRMQESMLDSLGSFRAEMMDSMDAFRADVMG